MSHLPVDSGTFVLYQNAILQHAWASLREKRRFKARWSLFKPARGDNKSTCENGEKCDKVQIQHACEPQLSTTA